MKFKFTLALLLSAIVLASSASASIITVLGGANSFVQNGGSSGFTGNTATYEQSSSSTLSGYGISGPSYNHWLKMVAGINANIANGQTGTARASYDTVTPQAFTFTDGSYVNSASLNGALSAQVTKTSMEGSASANAEMRAESGANSNAVGTFAQLYADETLSGVGATLASVKKATAIASSNYGTNEYSKSAVLGDITLTASNADDSPNAINGGVANGNARIVGNSYAKDNGDAAGLTGEFMTLNAYRAQSFTGRSYADGILNGYEMTESQWIRDNGPHVVDIESTSNLSEKVVALNVRDIAYTNAYLQATANVVGDNSANAAMDWRATAQTTRDVPAGTIAKAASDVLFPVATWRATGTMGNNEVALVSGTQGKAWDGIPAVNPGFGASAWIKSNYNQAQQADMHATQSADAENSVNTNMAAKATFALSLTGYSIITNTQADAVGAFGAVANQVVKTKQINGNVDNSQNPSIRDTNAINWLVGDDASALPGVGKYSPIDLVHDLPHIAFSSPNAFQRQTVLSYSQP